MTSDIIGAIIVWRSAATQNTAAPGGANSDYYMSLRPPYLARNGPFQTVRELLMVRGVTPELLLGNDHNQNGFLDSDEDPADQDLPGAKPPPPPNPGWAALLTVTDTDKDVNAAGKDRVNPQTADEATLSAVPGITAADCQGDCLLPGPEPVAKPGRSPFRHGAKSEPGRRERKRRWRAQPVRGWKPGGRPERFRQFRPAGDQPGVA